jgi:hypothetical protein
MEKQFQSSEMTRSAFIDALRDLDTGSAVQLHGEAEGNQQFDPRILSVTATARGQITLRDDYHTSYYIHLPVEGVQEWWPFLSQAPYRTTTDVLCTVDSVDVLTTDGPTADAVIRNGKSALEG